MGRQSYVDYSFVCYECIGDEYLKKQIKKSGGPANTCSFCAARRLCMDFSELADQVEQVLDDWYEPGEEHPVYDDNDTISHMEQRGADLRYIINEILGDCGDHVVDAIVKEITACNWTEKDDENSVYSTGASYVEKRASSDELDDEWNEVQLGIKHRARFFNTHARKFLDRLMHEIDSFHVPGAGSVIYELKPDLAIFRARRAENAGTLNQIRKDPRNQLGPPPIDRAATGRMNAEGVSVFYGALDRATCIAELRPNLGGMVVTGEFRLLRPVRVLDFHRLTKAYHHKSLSYFQPDFKEKVTLGVFLRQLHEKIRRPVLPGEEREYLVTQALAEYLSTVLEPRVDGMIFSSVQQKSGLNIVLWGDALDIQSNGSHPVMGTKTALKIKDDSTFVHSITDIAYSFDERDFVKKINGGEETWVVREPWDEMEMD